MREEGGTGDKWEGGVVVINLLHRLLSTRTQLAHPVLKSIKPPNHSFIHSRRKAFDFSNSYSLEIVTLSRFDHVSVVVNGRHSS